MPIWLVSVRKRPSCGETTGTSPHQIYYDIGRRRYPKRRKLNEIVGLREAAIAHCHQVVIQLKGHGEVGEVLKAGLPFSLQT